MRISEQNRVRRHHIILVPGFAGFDILGPVNYYQGAASILRSVSSNRAPVCVHIFQNLPTSGVGTRAQGLGLWLESEVKRGCIQAQDRIHLIGHSTGGLDIRQYVIDLHRGPPWLDEEITQWVRHALSSVQFVSTPHRGTNLAYHVNRASPLPQVLIRFAFLSLHTLGPIFWAVVGRTLRQLRTRPDAPTLTDALIDTFANVGTLHGGFEQAASRAVFYSIMRWTNEMASDFAAIEDLCPSSTRHAPHAAGPIHGKQVPEETSLYNSVAVRSIVTGAAPVQGGPFTIYTVLDRMLRTSPPESLGNACSLRVLGTPNATRWIVPTDHDGAVNSVSMVWPDPDRCEFVEADHADIIGHYGGIGAYDLLPSSVVFDDGRFHTVWSDIANFAMRASS